MIDGPRAAKLDELPAILDLVNEIFPFCRGLVGEILPHLFNEHNLDDLRVIIEDGKLVSHVGVWEGDLLVYGSWFKVGMIGAVCTRPDFRGRGYASSLVRDALSKMKQDGVDLVLISGDRSLYRRMGCFKAGIVYRFRVPAGKMNLKKDSFSIIPYEESRINDLIKIYQKEPVRYRRSLEDFELLAGRGFRCRDVPLRILMASEENRPLAYVATGLFPGERILRIWEYAGSRSVVLHLVENLFKITGSDSVEIAVPFHDWELICLLEAQGLEKPIPDAPASLGIINPQRFVEKAKPYLEERIGKNTSSKFRLDKIDEKLKLTMGRKEIALEDSGDLTFLFFGSPEEAQPKMNLRPVLEFLDEAVPMPTPTYGLNYI